MILVCDIGSSYTKVALLRRQLGEAKNVLCLSQRKFLPLEAQGAQCWTNLLFDISTLLAQQKTTLQQEGALEAMSFCGHGPSLLALDRDGKPITEVTNPIHRNHPSLSHFRGGSSFYLPLARLLWHSLSPATKKRVAVILPPINYISYLLTGNLMVPAPDNLRHFYWHSPSTSQERIQAGEASSQWTSFDAEFLPLLAPLCSFSDEVGKLTISAASYYNFPKELVNLPIFCPGVDFYAAELSLLPYSETLLHNRTGTSEGLNLLLSGTCEESQRKKLQSKLDNLPLASNKIFLNQQIITKRPQLSYIQEGVGILFAELFGLYSQLSVEQLTQNFDLSMWQNLMAKRAENAAKAPNLGTEPFHCPALQRSEESYMLKVILEQSEIVHTKTRQLVEGFYAKGLDRKYFIDSMLREQDKTSFAMLGSCILQLITKYFAVHSHSIFSIFTEYTGQAMTQQGVLVSGSQAYFPHWLAWKAKHSNTLVYVPEICEASFVGAAAMCYYKLGYFPTMEQASKSFAAINRSYHPHKEL